MRFWEATLPIPARLVCRRPDRIANPKDFTFNVAGQTALGCDRPVTRPKTLFCWFNQAAFALPRGSRYLSGRPSDECSHVRKHRMCRAPLRGPDYVDFDFSLYKTFQLGEKFRFSVSGPNSSTSSTTLTSIPNFGSGGGSSGAGIVNVPEVQPSPQTCQKLATDPVWSEAPVLKVSGRGLIAIGNCLQGDLSALFG